MPTLDSMRGELAYSSRIAAALLAVLAESGDLAARTRALRALGTQGAVVQGRGYWIRPAELAAMFKTAEVDARLARRIGQALVRPDAVGLALCYGGLATAEKAYRRSAHLLARESAGAHYDPRQIDLSKGRIRFHPPHGNGERLPDEVGQLMCVVRQGMLEAVPLLFGLVPATVRERRCGYAGGPHCEFEVKWSRGPRTGLGVGAGAGLVLGAGALLGSVTLGWPLWATGLAAPALFVLTAAAGRSIDLARQLEAVAGARRGHLALLDQLDGALAERMDTLAKVGAMPQTHHPASSEEDEEPTGLVPVDRRAGGRESSAAEREAIAPVARRRADVREVVARAIDAVRAEAGEDFAIERELGREAALVPCDPEQIAHVVEQLLRNAVAATRDAAEGQGDAVPVRVAVGGTPRGVEVCVEDGGAGIEPDVLDRVFDPFGDAGAARREGERGLPVCLRIVEGHGGELRIQAREVRGTRVSFVLPA